MNETGQRKSRPSLLVEGRIPPGQACPFKDECPIKDCNKQIASDNNFSCGSARGFDLVRSYKKE